MHAKCMLLHACKMHACMHGAFPGFAKKKRGSGRCLGSCKCTTALRGRPPTPFPIWRLLQRRWSGARESAWDHPGFAKGRNWGRGGDMGWWWLLETPPPEEGMRGGGWCRISKTLGRFERPVDFKAQNSSGSLRSAELRGFWALKSTDLKSGQEWRNPGLVKESTDGWMDRCR